MNEYLLYFKDVFVNCFGIEVLKNINLYLKIGDFLGIIGPNGAGKSTLLMSIIGFRNISKGEAIIFNENVREINSFMWSNIRKRIGYLPQKQYVDPFFPITVEEVVLMGRIKKSRFLSNYNDKDKEIVKRYMDEMGISHLRNRPIGMLSGGELQKVHLTRILVQEPTLILLDEPLSGLDFSWQNKISELIEGIARNGDKGIIMVTHETQHLPPSCNKIAIINDGRMTEVKQRNEFFPVDILSMIYKCKVDTFTFDGRLYISPWKKDD